MKHALLTLPILLALPGVATSEERKYVEPGDSMYICESAELATGLSNSYVKGDDFDMRSYAESTPGCMRIPPSAEAKFVALTSQVRPGGVFQVQIQGTQIESQSGLWMDAGQLNDHINYYNSTLEGAPRAFNFPSDNIGCPSLQSAIEHDRLQNLAKQNGAVFLGMSHESKKPGLREEFTCTSVRAHQNADAYDSQAKNGFVPVQLYETGTPLLWFRADGR